MDSVKIPLTDAQLRKLARGQGVRIKPTAKCTAYDVWCDAKKCKRMQRQMTKGKGYSLKLDPKEMEANEIEVEEGGRINWRKIGRTLRSTAKAAAKFYREKIRPTVGPKIRQAVKTAIEEGIPLAGEYLGAITGQPEIVAAAKSPAVKRFAEKTAKSGTEKLSKLTGAFGLSMKKPLSKQIYEMEHTEQVKPSKFQLQDNYSGFLNPNHPAMSPTLPMADNSLPLIGKGLFLAQAQGKGLFYAKTGRGMGSPMEPLLPQMDNSTYTMM